MKTLSKTLFISSMLFLSAAILLASIRPLNGEDALLSRHEWRRPAMGTIFRVIIYAGSREEAQEPVSRAFERIEKLEGILSFYQEDSELNRVAAQAYKKPVNVSPELFEVLEASLYWARQTGGAFDFTLRPLITLWHDQGEKGLPVSADVIQKTMSRIGYRLVLINPRLRSVRLESPGMQLDLGGIAKGFAADKALAFLADEGFSRVLIDAGGDLRLGDPPPGRDAWLVTIENEEEGRSRLRIHNAAVATSGDKYKYYDIDGIRYSHIVNPETGLGMTDQRQVTVIAGNAQSADALATALSVLDIEEGLGLVDSLEETEALIRVTDTGHKFAGKPGIYKTGGFPRLF